MQLLTFENGQSGDKQSTSNSDDFVLDKAGTREFPGRYFPNEMYQEILFLTRGIEAYRLVDENCALRRSNALRRRTRRSASKCSTLERVRSARKNFEKCIERCGAEADVDGTCGLSGYLKCVKKFRMKQKQIGRILRNNPVKQITEEGEEKEGLKNKSVPWMLKWRYRKIQPVCDIRKIFL